MFLFILSSVLPFVLWLDGGQRMSTEMLLVRGIDFCFFVDRSEDEWFRHYVPERQHCRSVVAPHGGLWSLADLETLDPLPLAWRTLVFV